MACGLSILQAHTPACCVLDRFGEAHFVGMHAIHRHAVQLAAQPCHKSLLDALLATGSSCVVRWEALLQNGRPHTVVSHSARHEVQCGK